MTVAPVAQAPARFTSIRRSLSRIRLITHDVCNHCGGAIHNDPISRSSASDYNSWVHLHAEDWEHDVHQAAPAGGPITDAEYPDAPSPAVLLQMLGGAARRITIPAGDAVVGIGGQEYSIRAVTVGSESDTTTRRRGESQQQVVELQRVDDNARFVWSGPRRHARPPAKARLIPLEPQDSAGTATGTQ